MSRVVTLPTSPEEAPLPERPTEPVRPSRRFRKLVARHIDLVARTVRRLGVPPTDIEDAVQKVFLTANGKLNAIHPEQERGFLIAVATRVASHERRAQARRERTREAVGHLPSPGVQTPERAAEQAQMRDLLDTILDRMDADLRAVFVLFELEELSLTEIASALEIPRGTAASRLRRAREDFQNQCADATAEGDSGGTA
ncbi:MAG: sigma-70 family RNA polymerase sigma factor [Deltaproteobacteria bacterium]|nr:sigma-70 family RNA polymerase sigma factor [Deltaproteobacteria bacterium]